MARFEKVIVGAILVISADSAKADDWQICAALVAGLNCRVHPPQGTYYVVPLFFT